MRTLLFRTADLSCCVARRGAGKDARERARTVNTREKINAEIRASIYVYRLNRRIISNSKTIECNELQLNFNEMIKQVRMSRALESSLS